LVDPSPAADPAAAESSPARGKRARRGRGADGPAAAPAGAGPDAEAGSGRKGRKASRGAADPEAGAAGPGPVRANGAGAGDAALFIRPGHRFRVVDALLTNFHLPRTPLLALVAALAGTELLRDAYAEAVRERYRFYSYGDAMLIT